MEVFLEGAVELAIDMAATAVECVIDAVYYVRGGADLEKKFEEQKRKRAERRAKRKDKEMRK